MKAYDFTTRQVIVVAIVTTGLVAMVHMVGVEDVTIIMGVAALLYVLTKM